MVGTTQHTITASNGESLAFTVSSRINEQAPVVIVVAGYTSKRLGNTNQQLIAALTAYDIATVAVDLSGHGDSSGDIADQTILKAAGELQDVIDFVRDQPWCNQHVGLIGSSFSGAAAIIAAAEAELTCLGLKSPMMDYAISRPLLLGDVAMQQWKKKGAIVLPDGTASKYEFMTAAEQVDLYQLLSILTCPLLVIQGSSDEEVVLTQAARIATILNTVKRQLVVLPGVDHGYTQPGASATMAKLFAEFFSQQLLVS